MGCINTPVRGEKTSKRLDEIKGCKNKTTSRHLNVVPRVFLGDFAFFREFWIIAVSSWYVWRLRRAYVSPSEGCFRFLPCITGWIFYIISKYIIYMRIQSIKSINSALLLFCNILHKIDHQSPASCQDQHKTTTRSTEYYDTDDTTSAYTFYTQQ